MRTLEKIVTEPTPSSMVYTKLSEFKAKLREKPLKSPVAYLFSLGYIESLRHEEGVDLAAREFAREEKAILAEQYPELHEVCLRALEKSQAEGVTL